MAAVLAPERAVLAYARRKAEATLYAHLLAIQPAAYACLVVQITRHRHEPVVNVYRPHPLEPKHTPLGEDIILTRAYGRLH